MLCVFPKLQTAASERARTHADQRDSRTLVRITIGYLPLHHGDEVADGEMLRLYVRGRCPPGAGHRLMRVNGSPTILDGEAWLVAL